MSILYESDAINVVYCNTQLLNWERFAGFDKKNLTKVVQCSMLIGLAMFMGLAFMYLGQLENQSKDKTAAINTAASESSMHLSGFLLYANKAF